eukprot:UN12615
MFYVSSSDGAVRENRETGPVGLKSQGGPVRSGPIFHPQNSYETRKQIDSLSKCKLKKQCLWLQKN